MRVGFGYDVHRFVEGRRLFLGGLEIDSPVGLAGHSDADALLHAIIDALLGAAALGDIGRHFPPGDPAYKDIESIKLLSRTVALVKEKGYSVGNIDSTVVCESPRLSAYVPAIVASIAGALQVSAERVSVKATTTEGLGFTGTGEGLAAYAVALLEEEDE